MKVLDVAGLAAVTLAAFLTAVPLGFLAAGGASLWLSWSMSRDAK